MSDDIFNIFATIGIGLTFLASIATVVVSIFSLIFTIKAEKHTGYLNTITVSRDKWSSMLREKVALYFAQIALFCSSDKTNVQEEYDKLLQCHYAVELMFFECDADVKKCLNVILKDATMVKHFYNNYENQKEEIKEMKRAMSHEHQRDVLNIMKKYLEGEWRKQQQEALQMETICLKTKKR